MGSCFFQELILPSSFSVLLIDTLVTSPFSKIPAEVDSCLLQTYLSEQESDQQDQDYNLKGSSMCFNMATNSATACQNLEAFTVKDHERFTY